MSDEQPGTINFIAADSFRIRVAPTDLIITRRISEVDEATGGFQTREVFRITGDGQFILSDWARQYPDEAVRAFWDAVLTMNPLPRLLAECDGDTSR